MKAPALFAGALACCLLNSCGTIYVKDLIHGDAYERSYKLNFRNAVAEGATAEEARRTAEFVAGQKQAEASARREAEEEAMEEFRREINPFADDDPDLRIKWD